jgi:NAD+ diphosphatase
MLHEIEPHKLYNEFRKQSPRPTDFLVVYFGDKSLLKKNGDSFEIPKVADFNQGNVPCHYLFSIDDAAYFLADLSISKELVESASDDYVLCPARTYRYMGDPLLRLGGATAAHIAHWESQNRFCGRCGSETSRSDKERAIVCPKCGNVVYPRISPVVIVAVHNGDKLLMAHNIDNPNPRLFLISGFVEVGESLEQAVYREVLEEAGVHVKNVRYFGSQPWPFPSGLMVGFTADYAGGTIHVQREELKNVAWFHRDHLPKLPEKLSIARRLIDDWTGEK